MNEWILGLSFFLSHSSSVNEKNSLSFRMYSLSRGVFFYDWWRLIVSLSLSHSLLYALSRRGWRNILLFCTGKKRTTSAVKIQKNLEIKTWFNPKVQNETLKQELCFFFCRVEKKWTKVLILPKVRRCTLNVPMYIYIYRPFLTISSSNDDVLIDRVLMIAESLIT